MYWMMGVPRMLVAVSTGIVQVVLVRFRHITRLSADSCERNTMFLLLRSVIRKKNVVPKTGLASCPEPNVKVTGNM